jgi:uncharacterized protein YacL (UPF0231 family)
MVANWTSSVVSGAGAKMVNVKWIAASLLLSLSTIGQLSAADGESKVKLSECPKVVQKTLKRESSDGKIKDVNVIEDEAATLYAASITLGGREYQVMVAQDGTLVQKVLDDEQDHTEQELDLDLEDCPPVVQKTLVREADGYEIDLVVERVTNGETMFMADIRHDGRDYLVIVADDGTLISKTLYDQEEQGDGPEEDEMIVI